MEYDDIVQETLSQLTNDTRALIQACSLNTKTRKLCASRAYWDRIFKQEGLEMPIFNYSSAKGWILEYEKKKRIQLYVTKAIKILINPQDSDFHIMDPMAFIDQPETLVIYNNSLNWYNIINVDEIDRKEIAMLDNEILQFLYGNYDAVGEPDIATSIDIKYISNNNYEISLSYVGYDERHLTGIKYNISTNSVEKILTKLFLLGNIPMGVPGGVFMKLNV